MFRRLNIILLTTVLLLACSAKIKPKMVQHIRGSSFSATNHGYYTAELVMKPKQPVVGPNRAHLIVHNYEGEDVPGLRVIITPYLPDKEIVSPEKPKVKDAGRGLYIIDNIVFTEPGDWVLKIRLIGKELSDSVTLKIPTVK